MSRAVAGVIMIIVIVVPISPILLPSNIMKRKCCHVVAFVVRGIFTVFFFCYVKQAHNKNNNENNSTGFCLFCSRCRWHPLKTTKEQQIEI